MIKLRNVAASGRSFGVLFGVVLAISLAACVASPVDTPNVTNATATGFVDMAPGSEEDFILNVGRRTYFAEGASSLDETAEMTLDKQAAWLAKYPTWKIKLQGFADDPGDELANRAVSAQRAFNVMAYLASKGVASDRMWAKGYGRERLVRDCPEIECKSQNRRVISNLRQEFDDAATN